MALQVGFDCTTHLDVALNGTTRANWIVNRGSLAGRGVVFAGRYFGGPNYNFGGNVECIALTSAIHLYNGGTYCWIAPLTSPRDYKTSATDGANDATIALNGLLNALGSNLAMPASSRLYVYLDIENGTLTNPSTFNAAYWNAWASTINSASLGSTTPFYASAYVGHLSSGSGGNYATGILVNATGINRCYELWSNSPQFSCASPPPGWGAIGTAPPNFQGGLYTGLWQYSTATSGTSGGCNNGIADADTTSPYDTLLNYMLVASVPNQRTWWYCSKCHTLHWSGYNWGHCPAGNAHDNATSFEFYLVANAPGFTGAQNGWKYCNYCSCLVWLGNGGGICPGNGYGSHGTTGSWDFYLVYLPEAGFPGQGGWMFCNRCHCIYYQPQGPSVCASGLGHDYTGSNNFALTHF
jgi:hypothetical protein